jgi:hypothetical protein
MLSLTAPLRKLSVLGLTLGALVLLLTVAPIATSAAAAPPSNDNFADATVISLPFTDTQDTSDTSIETGERGPMPGGLPDVGKTVWYRYTASGTGHYYIDLAGFSNRVFNIYLGTTGVDVSSIFFNLMFFGQSSSSIFDLTAGQTVYIQVGGEVGAGGPAAGSFTIHMSRLYSIGTQTVLRRDGEIVPPSGGSISCESGCQYAQGETMVLLATPRPSQAFDGWDGCDSVSGRRCSATMNSDKDITANFAVIPLVVDDAGDGGDNAPGDGDCATSADVCTLRAAIQESHALALGGSSAGLIDFAIGSGQARIQPTSALPPVSSPWLMIDGRSQGGPGYDGHPLIEINGSHVGGQSNGLSIEADRADIIGLDINGWGGAGIYANGNGLRVTDSYLGTNPTGTSAVPNQFGISLYGPCSHVYGPLISCGASAATIGGTEPGDSNLISGNSGAGIVTNFGGHSKIQGNYIGTAADGSGPLGNGGPGIDMKTVGGNQFPDFPSPGSNLLAGNVIAFNGQQGVRVVDGLLDDAVPPLSDETAQVNITQNSIHDNVGLGLDLGLDGATANDPGDVDVGANGLQNYPTPDADWLDEHSAAWSGTLDSNPATNYRVELFESNSCDPSGFGEGQNFVGSTQVTTNNSGFAPIHLTNLPDLPVGHVVTATATATAIGKGETSEFSPCQTVRSVPVPPTTRIAEMHVDSTRQLARFRFRSSGVTGRRHYECRLDRTPFVRCRSPKTYRDLDVGWHIFKVRAEDSTGNVDASAASRRFKIRP